MNYVVILLMQSIVFAEGLPTPIEDPFTRTLVCPSGYRIGFNVIDKTSQCLPSNEGAQEEVDGNAVPGEPPRPPRSTESAEEVGQVYQDCINAHKRAESACKRVEQTGMASQLLGQFSQVKAAGNIKEACGLAKQISALSAGANVGFGVQCQRTASACATACDPKGKRSPSDFRPYQSECVGFKDNAIAGYIQAGADAANFAISAQCEKAADAKCVGQNAVNDPDCVQFCSQPGRESHPKCALAGANCQNPTFAQQNAQFCQCLQNPFGPNCSTAQFPNRPNNNGNDPLAGLRTNVGGLGDGENDFLGKPRGGSNSGAGGPNGGGSGFNGGAGASSPIAGDGSGEGNGDEPLNKEILTGSGGGSGGAGGFFGYGSGGGEGSAGGGGRGGSGSGDGGSGIDLRAFLPGGKNDPRRGPASLEEASGITKSDGLTNFQKVTRKINQKLVEGDLNP